MNLLFFPLKALQICAHFNMVLYGLYVVYLTNGLFAIAVLILPSSFGTCCPSHACSRYTAILVTSAV